jgi:Ca2+-binding RTX toxin-like protein
MTIDAVSGVFGWTPTESQGGASYQATISVTDDGVNPANLTDSETITITVHEVNKSPVLGAIGNRSVNEQASLSFTVTATDPDRPEQGLRYSLDRGALDLGMTIDAVSGVFGWTPEHQDLGQHLVRVTVTDNGTNPDSLNDFEEFTITVDGIVSLPSAKKGYGLLLRINPRDPQKIELINAKSTETRFWTGPVNRTYGLTIVGLDNKADTLTLDAANGPLTNLQQVFFDAKGGGAKIVDTLVIKNSAKNPPATNDRVEILADRVVFNSTAYLTEALESISVDTGKGDDTIVVSALGKSVTIVDSTGTELLDFSQAAGALTLDLSNTKGQKILAGSAYAMTLKGTFENVVGTEQADLIRGNKVANRIEGRGGDDTIYGGAGDDTFYGGEGNDWLYGDAGNDTHYGELGNNVLLGGDGNDILNAAVDAAWRNLLIGSQGADAIQGGSGDDILIGGTTSFDGNAAALTLIMQEWTSDHEFRERCDNLSNGFPLGKLLVQLTTAKSKKNPKGTLFDDKARDDLFGNSGHDWFLALAADDIQDRTIPEDR